MSDNRFSELMEQFNSGTEDMVQASPGPAPILLSDGIVEVALERALPRKDRARLDRGPNLVVIDCFSADMAEAVGDWLRQQRIPAAIETVTEKRKVMGRVTMGGENALDHLEKGRPVIVISQDPLGLVAATVRAAADMTVTIPELDLAQVRKLVRRVTGRTVRGLRADDIVGLDIADLQASIRPGLTGARCRELLRRCAASKRIPRSNVHVPPLADMTFTRPVAQWVEETRALMAGIAAGTTPPRDLPFSIFEGLPGGGKTTLAAAMAQEMKWEFVPTSVQAWFDESDGHLGGVTRASRRFFESVLTSRRPVIGFIDEIESLPNRATMEPRDSQWWTPVVTGVLTDIDKCRHSGRPILLIGATNHFGRLDAALVRPGRLETRLSFASPALEERQEMFARRLGGQLNEAELRTIARLAAGATPAHIDRWCVTAKARALRDERSVLASDLIELIAPERRSPPMLWAVALHESGHAVVAHELGLEIAEVSLLARDGMGGSMGAKINDMLLTREDVETLITVAMGGRAADVILGSGANAGAAADLAFANQLIDDARTRFGLYGSLRPATADAATIESAEELLGRLARRAETIAAARREDVLALAEVLLEDRVMTPDRVMATLAGPRRSAARKVEASASGTVRRA